MFLDTKKLQITLPEGVTKEEIKIEGNNVKFNVTANQDGDFNIQATYNGGSPISIPLTVKTPTYSTSKLSTEQTEFHPEDEIAVVVEFNKKLPKLTDLVVTPTPAESVAIKGEPETNEDVGHDKYTVTYKYTAKQVGEGHKFSIVYKEGEPVDLSFSISAEPEIQQGNANPNNIEQGDKSEITIPFVSD